MIKGNEPIIVLVTACLMFLLVQNAWADEIKFKFKNPSFSGQGTGAHYLTIENQEKSRKDKIKADRAVSILAIVGVAIIPVIKKSVDWWQTLHQPSTFKLTSAPSMSPEMYQPLLICVIGFYLVFAFILTLNLRNEILERESSKKWVKEVIGNQS